MKSFKPIIQTITNSRPSPLFLGGLCPSLWHVPLPDISDCSFEQELDRVCNAYKQHQLDVNKRLYSGNDYNEYLAVIEQTSLNNVNLSWTVAKGFKYFRNNNETLCFNRQCKLTKHLDMHVEPTHASLSIK